MLLCGLAGGCATQGPQPTEEMTRARTLIEQADRSGAQRYAAADLQRAHVSLATLTKPPPTKSTTMRVATRNPLRRTLM